jgi:hypothetical protein
MLSKHTAKTGVNTRVSRALLGVSLAQDVGHARAHIGAGRNERSASNIAAAPQHHQTGQFGRHIAK